METTTVFFVGKPGCGKGTQAALLGEETDWPVFASGHLFREITKEDTPVGRLVKRENDTGMLQPHWFAMYLYLKSLFSLKEGQSVIFDGFNRKVPEAELIIDSLTWLGRPFKVINIVISDEEAHKRIDKRRETSGRTDDHVAAERLTEFYEHTVKAIALFRDAGALLDIDGERPVEAIAADSKVALKLTPPLPVGPTA